MASHWRRGLLTRLSKPVRACKLSFAQSLAVVQPYHHGYTPLPTKTLLEHGFLQSRNVGSTFLVLVYFHLVAWVR
jgi:hypothetical protein